MQGRGVVSFEEVRQSYPANFSVVLDHSACSGMTLRFLLGKAGLSEAGVNDNTDSWSGPDIDDRRKPAKTRRSQAGENQLGGGNMS